MILGTFRKNFLLRLNMFNKTKRLPRQNAFIQRGIVYSFCKPSYDEILRWRRFTPCSE